MNRIQRGILLALLAGTTGAQAQFKLASAASAMAGIKDLLSTQGKTEVAERPAPPVLPPANGPRQTICVGEFANQSGHACGALNRNLKTMLESALTQCGRFTVVNRTTLDSHMREIGLGQSGWGGGNPGATRPGQLKQAVFIAEGAVTGANDGTGKSSNSGRMGGIKVGFDSKTATLSINLKVSDTSSGEILVQNDFTGRAGSRSLMLGLDLRKLDLGLGREANQPLDEAAQDVIAQAVNAIAQAMEGRLASTAPRETQVTVEEVIADENVVIVKPGAKGGLVAEQELTFKGPKDKYGFARGPVTQLRVVEVTDDFARCELKSGPLPAAQATSTLVMN